MRLQSARLLACLLCLLCCLCALPNALAELFEPRGQRSPAEAEKEQAVQIDHPFKLFDTQFPRGSFVYATRFFGRVAVGDKVSNGYTPGSTVPAHLLQPLEIFATFKAVAATLYYANITGDLLANMSSLVRANFWQVDDFNATGGYLFTWENQMASSDASKNNTFQLALVFDESSTYTVYNYHRVTFVQHLDNPIMAGFALRRSHEISLLPFSGLSADRLPSASGLGDRKPGRFVYRVDSWPPIRGGCLSEDPKNEQDRKLASSLTRDSLLGGGLAIMSGRCPDARNVGVCRVSIEGKQVSERPAVRCDRCDDAFVACEVPPSLRIGLGVLSLVQGSHPAYNREFAFLSPDNPEVVKIFFNESMDAWMETQPAKLSIAYEANSSLNGSLKLQVVGYSEAGLSQIGRPEDFDKLTKVLYEGPASSDGRMNLRDNKAIRCPATSAADCESYHVGFLRILDAGSPAYTIRSRIIPLGWFVQPYYQEKQSLDWPATKCKAWHDARSSETVSVESALRALSCPGRLNQTLANPGRFLPITYCPTLAGGCSTATPKQSCFLSSPTTGSDVHGVPTAVCCYNEAEDLLYQEARDDGSAGLTQFGSSSARSHPRGLPLSSQPLLPGQASYLSHWYWDALPHLYCCRWSSAGQCHLYYMQMRPTPRPSVYAAGVSSHMVGDPHVTSFGGRQFLFNGYGEYWLMRSDNIELQARYETLSGAGAHATFMTALAARSGSSYLEVLAQATGRGPRFLVQRRPSADSDLAMPVDVSQTALEPYLDSGMVVQLSGDDLLTIQLTSGSDTVGIQLKAAGGNFTFMDPFLSLSASLRGRTRGLLGRWTTNPADEFVDARGNKAEFSANASAFHTDFCAKNLLSALADSFFSYSGDNNRLGGFNELNINGVNSYKPVFDLPPAAHPQESSVCGSSADADCVFDLRITQNVGVAASTAATGRMFADMREAENSTAAASVCDVPPIPGIRIGRTALTVGTSLSIECAQPLKVNKAVQPIVCTRRGGDGNSSGAAAAAVWVPDPAGLGVQCGQEALVPGQASIGLIVGIVVPVVVLLLVAVVLIVFLLRFRSNQKQPESHMAGRQVPMSQQQQQQQQDSAGSAYRSSRPGGNDELMSKGYHHPADQDDGSHRNPRPPPRQQPGYTGVSTVDTDDSAAGFGGGRPPQATGQPPVAAQRNPRSSYNKSQHDPVMRQDDGAAAFQHPQHQPSAKARGTVSHSEVV